MSATRNVGLQAEKCEEVRAHDEPRAQGISREDVIRGIRNEPLWRALPLGQWAMRAAPGDIGMAALYAARLAGRGAGNLASACIEQLRGRVKANSHVLDAAQVLAIDQELVKAQEAFTRGVVAPCASSEVRDVIARRIQKLEGEGGGEEVRAFAQACEWFVCEDGAALGVQEDGLIWGLEADVGAAKEAVARMMGGGGDETGSGGSGGSGGGGGFAKPILIAGLHNPQLLIQACREYKGGYNGYLPRIYAFESDARVVATAMAHRGMDEVVGQARVCWAIGSGAHEQLRALFHSHRHRALPECAYQQPRVIASGGNVGGGGGGGAGAGCSAILEQAKEAQTKHVQSTYQLISQKYASGKHAWLNASGESWQGARVLVLTSRYTTFLKHSAHDLAESLTRLGAHVRVMMEPDDYSLQTTGAYLAAIHEHEPDVVFTINYPRSSWGGVLPQNVPLVCWVQDAMPHLFDASAGAGQGKHDLVVGHLFPELFEQFGFSQERTVAAAVVADEVKFHSSPVGSEALARYECDVALVSHHSETPDAMHDRLVSSAKVAPVIARVMDWMYLKLKDVVARAGVIAPVQAVENVIVSAMREELGNEGDAKSRTLLLRTYAMPLADRILRHQTLEWLDEMATRRGWRMKLYGRGWDCHPTLNRYAAGELEHGEALRAAYQGAKAHLHLSLHSLVHQRVLECYLSGGVCLVRWHRDALAGLKTTAHLALMKVAPDSRICRDTGEDGSGRREVKEHVGYLISKHEAAGVFARQCSALGQPIEGDMLWIPATRLSNLAAMGSRVNTQTDLGEVLGEDFGHGVFRDSAELEARIERVIMQASEDPQMRRVHIEKVRSRVVAGFTYSALLKRVGRALCVGEATGVRQIADEMIIQGRGQ